MFIVFLLECKNCLPNLQEMLWLHLGESKNEDVLLQVVYLFPIHPRYQFEEINKLAHKLALLYMGVDGSLQLPDVVCQWLLFWFEFDLYSGLKEGIYILIVTKASNSIRNTSFLKKGR